jgi:hypothetical protein
MIELERLVLLALDELDDAAAAEVEAHILACGACATTLERLLRIGRAVRELIRAGQATFPCSAALIEEMRAAALISREYRLAPDQVVACTAGAADIYAATTLEADLRDVAQVDIVITSPAGSARLQDVPFDAERGLATYVSRSDQLRTLPSTRIELELLAVDPAGERKLGQYFLEHTAFVPRTAD